jgi:hypothetical protein
VVKGFAGINLGLAEQTETQELVREELAAHG